MRARQPWVAHEFPVGIDTGWIYNIMARLEDAPMRILALSKENSELTLSTNWEDAWSIKEHIGHLIDLETLHYSRLEQFAARISELQPADMSNAQTEAMNYSTLDVLQLNKTFEQVRTRFIEKYLSLEESVLEHQAFHPRLKVMMRPVDLMYFVAEHDDHHIASMKHIVQKFKK